MRAKTFLVSIFLYCLTCQPGKAQTTQSPVDNSIIGVWSGTSLCQVKNSPCHNENVVYRISKGHGVDSFDVSASKIVNGKELEMGIIFFRFDKAKNQLTASSNGSWIFNLKGKLLEGTLTSNDGSLFRIVKLSKQQ